MTRKLAAWLNLAWHFNKHVFTRLWLRPFRHGRDLARFEGAVEPEGYVPLLADERAAVPASMRCVHCGLCAIPCTREKNFSAWEEAWTFAGGASRSLDHAQLVAADLAHCAEDPTNEMVCPTRVPITRMAAGIRRMADANTNRDAVASPRVEQR